MIGRLTGTVVSQEVNDAIVLDVGGVGYELQVPLGTFGRASPGTDGKTTLFVHTHVREDALTLFGFASEKERLAFRILIGVSNVGPKIAMAVLSALPADDLARAILSKDVTRLQAISGVGKKTAERLVLELRDKLPTPADGPSALPSARAKAARGGNEELLRGALANMNFRPIEIDRALGALAEKIDHTKLPELIREALALLAK